MMPEGVTSLHKKLNKNIFFCHKYEKSVFFIEIYLLLPLLLPNKCLSMIINPIYIMFKIPLTYI